MALRVYIDVCCLNRPFDNQAQDKVRLESEAVISILKRCGDIDVDWELIGSAIIALEVSKNHDTIKRQKVLLLHEIAAEKIKLNEAVKSLAADFRKSNVKQFDSLHLAIAEYAKADVFLTTDGRLIKAALRSDIKVRVANPLIFYLEVLANE
jgi:predicted nucleic acid-binding protein